MTPTASRMATRSPRATRWSPRTRSAQPIRWPPRRRSPRATRWSPRRRSARGTRLRQGSATPPSLPWARASGAGPRTCPCAPAAAHMRRSARTPRRARARRSPKRDPGREPPAPRRTVAQQPAWTRGDVHGVREAVPRERGPRPLPLPRHSRPRPRPRPRPRLRRGPARPLRDPPAPGPRRGPRPKRPRPSRSVRRAVGALCGRPVTILLGHPVIGLLSAGLDVKCRVRCAVSAGRHPRGRQCTDRRPPPALEAGLPLGRHARAGQLTGYSGGGCEVGAPGPGSVHVRASRVLRRDDRVEFARCPRHG